MQALLDALVGLLPVRWQRVAKALVPFVLAGGAAVAVYASTGQWDVSALLLLVGGGSSLGVHGVRNAPEPDRLEADLSDLV